jgi:hypothetical protein
MIAERTTAALRHKKAHGEVSRVHHRYMETPPLLVGM